MKIFSTILLCFVTVGAFAQVKSTPWTTTVNPSNALYGVSSNLWRLGANQVDQRRGTSAQTYNLFQNFTDVSNYRRLSETWSGTDFILSLGGSGTGTNSGDFYIKVDGAHSFRVFTREVERFRIENNGVLRGDGSGLTNLTFPSTVSSLTVTNFLTPTNAGSVTVINFTNSSETITLSANLAFTSVVGVVDGMDNTHTIHVWPGGANRTVSYPVSVHPSQNSLGVITNGVFTDLIFSSQVGVRTNVAQIDYP